jgi:hypothetical protein
MPRPHQQGIAEQAADESQHLRVGCRMKTMAPVVDLDARELEAACIASDSIGSLENGHGMSGPRQAQSRTKASRTGSQDRDRLHRRYIPLPLKEQVSRQDGMTNMGKSLAERLP